MHIYSAQHWIEGDEVRVISGTMAGTWGIILTVKLDDGMALVDLAYVPGSNSELIDIDVPVSFPITDLRRCICSGHHVCVLDTSAEKSEYKGKEGIVLEAVGDTLIVLDSDTKSEFVVSRNSVQTNIVDRGLSTSFSTIAQTSTALPDDLKPMRGDDVVVQKVGDLHLKTGKVIAVDAASNQLTFLISGTQNTCLTVPVPWISTVLDVDLSNNTLTFQGPFAKITIPITHATRTSSAVEHNPMKSFIGKQVMVIHGHMKLLHGTLRSLARNTCQVDFFQGQRQQLPRSHVVSETGELINGGRLSAAQLKIFIQMLHKSYIQRPMRARTPPPSPPPPSQSASVPHPDPWSLDPSDELFEEAPSIVPVIQVTLEYDPCSRLSSLLARCQLVLRVLPAPYGTWYQNYYDHLVHTQVPDPFLLMSGPVAHGNIAVTYILRTRNTGQKEDEIPMCYISTEPPTGSSKCFVVICGDDMGTVYITKVAKRNEAVITMKEGKKIPCAHTCLLGDGTM
ncbi:hypothetical protein CY34DRAFT_110246 [Suillus luteus UH-Slu-Lm8-n1]|uniref:Uncharacterized protein n=1 Tax=Suillus luteus UH-Slu-Lm8-n1 TaxID=930992 RepID=A0A0D0ARG3_9AGAM|nr:hypothetical protein CY34DRAFT_110246 [Suillus luteus UH-Slu-Lm8-n1]